MNLEQVLRDHKLWLDDSLTGERADLSGANLCSADLSSANLSGANLRSAKLDYSIYQFFIGSFNAVATPDFLSIGCERHPWETWLDEVKRKEIADKNGVNDAAFTNHSKMIVLMHELITNPARTNK